MVWVFYKCCMQDTRIQKQKPYIERSQFAERFPLLYMSTTLVILAAISNLSWIPFFQISVIILSLLLSLALQIVFFVRQPPSQRKIYCLFSLLNTVLILMIIGTICFCVMS